LRPGLGLARQRGLIGIRSHCLGGALEHLAGLGQRRGG
jgi:hypothetical protein